jgi:hypothetical protein
MAVDEVAAVERLYRSEGSETSKMKVAPAEAG